MKGLALILVIVVALASRVCAQSIATDGLMTDEKAEAKSSPPSAHLADPNYHLQADDVVEVTVFREPDLTTQGVVGQDGSFDMKLIGGVKVAGRTADEAGEAIRVALAKDYLVDPRISVGIVEYARRKVNVLGEVRSPGVYLCPSRGPMFLSDALAMAGGLLPSADVGHIGVYRTGEGRAVALQVNAVASPDFKLLADDAVNVPDLPRQHVTVLGQVARPGTYEFTENHAFYLTDAIALAGGFTRIANPSHVLLKRTLQGRETVAAFNAKAMENSPKTQRLQLLNEDTITVPESLF